MQTMSKTKKMCFSGILIAMYVVVMYLTQGFAFGQYQMRVATGFYSLAYFFPFLIVPLGLANAVSNFFLGSFGVMDAIGGMLVGVLASGGVFLVRLLHFHAWLVIPIIIFIPGLIVPIWLSRFTGVPYLVLVLSLCIGQSLPAVLGYILVKILPNLGVERL